jgi:hypothetical protein
MEKRKFWPLDYDPEGEIYDNLAWDLPGYRSPLRGVSPLRQRRLKDHSAAAVEKTLRR